MRVVENAEEFESQMNRAISEALNAFGDGAVFLLKKYVGLQDISKFKWRQSWKYFVFIRKRMQYSTSPSKVIEEAPSSVLTPELRKKMGRLLFW
jgi:propionyl-CoA carboxylase alpha chain